MARIKESIMQKMVFKEVFKPTWDSVETEEKLKNGAKRKQDSNALFTDRNESHLPETQERMRTRWEWTPGR